MRNLIILSLCSLCTLMTIAFSQSQSTADLYLVRVERQTREEDVCMLVLKDGRYHLERIAGGTPRVFEGTLSSASLAELKPLLATDDLVKLKQDQIESAPTGGDLDQVMLTTSRATGRQTLTFPNPKSRKPYRASLDPILKWLDRNKQQGNAIPGAITTRCVPPHGAYAAHGSATAEGSNSYVMRIAIDHYEPSGSGTAISSVSAAKGTTGQTVGGMTNTDAMDVNAFRVTRTCALVYANGRYRFERSIQEAGKSVGSKAYLDTISQTQVDELHQILDNPKLIALPNNVAPTVLGREGDLIQLTVPRAKSVQSVGFASTGPRPASADLRDSAFAALSASVGLTNPIRKWIKQNLEDPKVAATKEVSATNCFPSAQPE